MIMMNGFTLGFFFPKQSRFVKTAPDPQPEAPVAVIRRDDDVQPRDLEIEYSPFLHIHRRF
jgi:hypothetical protein